MSWRDDALCLGNDPTIWFILEGRHGGNNSWAIKAGVEKAKAFCESCNVQTDCLQYALQHPRLTRHGIFGGYTPKERADIKTRA